jgi:hypothetical protein
VGSLISLRIAPPLRAFPPRRADSTSTSRSSAGSAPRGRASGALSLDAPTVERPHSYRYPACRLHAEAAPLHAVRMLMSDEPPRTGTNEISATPLTSGLFVPVRSKSVLLNLSGRTVQFRMETGFEGVCVPPASQNVPPIARFPWSCHGARTESCQVLLGRVSRRCLWHAMRYRSGQTVGIRKVEARAIAPMMRSNGLGRGSADSHPGSTRQSRRPRLLRGRVTTTEAGTARSEDRRSAAQGHVRWGGGSGTVGSPGRQTRFSLSPRRGRREWQSRR